MRSRSAKTRARRCAGRWLRAPGADAGGQPRRAASAVAQGGERRRAVAHDARPQDGARRPRSGRHADLRRDRRERRRPARRRARRQAGGAGQDAPGDLRHAFAAGRQLRPPSVDDSQGASRQAHDDGDPLSRRKGTAGGIGEHAARRRRAARRRARRPPPCSPPPAAAGDDDGTRHASRGAQRRPCPVSRVNRAIPRRRDDRFAIRIRDLPNSGGRSRRRGRRQDLVRPRV